MKQTIKESQLRTLIREEVRKVLKEDQEYDALLNHKIKNPGTGNDIKVSSALSYDTSSSVYKAAVAFLNKNKKSAKDFSKSQSEQPKRGVDLSMKNTSAKKGTEVVLKEPHKYWDVEAQDWATLPKGSKLKLTNDLRTDHQNGEIKLPNGDYNYIEREKLRTV